jgi:TonB family protein
MKKVLILLFSLTFNLAYSQVTKKYFDRNNKETTNIDVADAYKIFTQKDSLLVVTAYDISGWKWSEYNFRRRIKQGTSDTINIHHGAYSVWDKNGNIWKKGNYQEDKMHGEQTTLYPSGKTQRIEILENGKFISGQCFDKEGKEEEFYHTIVEEQPEFQGGQNELFSYLGRTLKYPKKARKDGVEGTIYVGFIVEANGKISNVALKRGVHPLLNEEAIKVVSEMPKWKPGKINDKFVRVAYTVPIKFKLE